MRPDDYSGWAISIPSLPVAQFPNLAPPQVVVTSGYIGANAQTVESAVTIPLEQTINGRARDEVHQFHKR